MNRRELLATLVSAAPVFGQSLTRKSDTPTRASTNAAVLTVAQAIWRAKCWFRASSMAVNLNFVHRCQIMPGGGVGHHFHNQCEEMFVIFDGEAEFTIDGRTSALRGTVGAPCRMGHSHAIYNPSNQPVEFMNINVSAVKGHYDAFNLDDPRTNVPVKDPIPVFMTMHLDRKLLRPTANYRGGQGSVQYRRALDQDVFSTNWSYVDHLLIPATASEGVHRHRSVEEIYYVLNGSGQVRLNDEQMQIQKGDAVPVLLNQAHSFSSTAGKELELMVIGISVQKGVVDVEEGESHLG